MSGLCAALHIKGMARVLNQHMRSTYNATNKINHLWQGTDTHMACHEQDVQAAILQGQNTLSLLINRQVTSHNVKLHG